jgi:hypothetical protein
MTKQNPNINFTTANSTINVNGTIVKAIIVNDPTKYSAFPGQPVDPNSKDPLIQGLTYTIDGGPDGTGKVTYHKNGVDYDSLNSYAQSPAVRFGAGYTANTTKSIQTAMQKNIATAISTSIPIQPSAQNPNPGGNGAGGIGVGNLIDAATTLWNNLGNGFDDLSKLDFKSANEEELFTKNAKLLKYPADILERNQDTLQISMYNYQAPKGDLFTNSTPEFRVDILTKGIQRNSALKKYIGTVILPIPAGISDSNNVNWGEDNMNNLTAAVTNYVANHLQTQTVATGAAQAGQALAGLPASAITFLGTIGKASNGSIDPNLLAQLKAPITSSLLKQAGFEVSPESILARGFGIVPNSNMELLFTGPTLRDFTFAYRMSPRSEEEARHVKRIIRFFKQGSAPKKLNSTGGAGGRSTFLGTPNVFKLRYITTGNKDISGLNKFKICALRSVAVNYAPDGTWAAYDEGQPVSLTMSLNFQELEPIYESDYQIPVSADFKGNKDVSAMDNFSPVNNDDVGY